jgi:hypothetical protein
VSLEGVGMGMEGTPDQGLKFLVELERTGAITETSLQLPPDVPYDQYEALAYMFGRVHRQTAWVLGDLLNYGEKVYGEKFAQAEAATGLAKSTLENYCSVCNRIPRSRRKKSLAFSIHAEVASLSPAEQTEWLSKASKEGWRRGRIREELAPMRAAAELEVAQKREARTAMLNGDVPVEPTPAVKSHLCECRSCGRVHRNDVDVDG